MLILVTIIVQKENFKSCILENTSINFHLKCYNILLKLFYCKKEGILAKLNNLAEKRTASLYTSFYLHKG